MASHTSKFIAVEGEGEDEVIIILEDAFITPKNVNKFKYTFDNPADITESIRKNETSTTSQISTHVGRMGYAFCKCTYSDGSSSTTMVLTGIVIQYVKTMGKENSKYGNGYIFGGIPEIYLREIEKQARLNSGRTVSVKEKTQLLSGHHWVTFDTKKMSTADVNITVDANGQIRKMPVSLTETLKEMKQNIHCNVTVTINASIISKTLEEELDLAKGQYNFTFKLLGVDIMKESNVKAPELESLERRKKEKRDESALNLATSKIAQLAISRLE